MNVPRFLPKTVGYKQKNSINAQFRQPMSERVHHSITEITGPSIHPISEGVAPEEPMYWSVTNGL